MDLVFKLRRKKGWSQQQLAQAADVGAATIKRIEAGQVIPNAETAQSIAAALDVEASQIRESAGLIGRLQTLLPQLDAEPPPTINDLDLKGLPDDLASAARTYCNARILAANSQARLQETSQRSIAAHDAFMRAMRAADCGAADLAHEAQQLEYIEYQKALDDMQRNMTAFAEAYLRLQHVLLALYFQ